MSGVIDTVVVGGGQAGLAAGHHLRRAGRDVVILDAGAAVGQTWRTRWDSLRLFTPACVDHLPGMRFPSTGGQLPTKDQMADYLVAYAARWQLPVELGARVTSLTRDGRGRYLLAVGGRHLRARNVIVATGANRAPRVPGFAGRVAPGVGQLHASAYRRPTQLQAGRVLVVGAGNSGCEIALDLAPHHDVWLSGRDVGHLPAVPGCLVNRLVRRLGVGTPLGRWVAGKRGTGGDPVVRVRHGDLQRAGVVRVPPVDGIREGLPLVAGRPLEVDHIIWATGYEQGLDWIDLPVFDGCGRVRHDRGAVAGAPGLHLLGFPMQRTLASDLVGGVGADAQHIIRRLLPA